MQPSIATATSIETLLAGTEGKEEIAIPPEALQDKVFFIFNNLSLANMEQKGSELQEIITEEFTAWVAQYLVMKRASIEANFHTLYANFIDHINKTDVLSLVIKETFRNIKVSTATSFIDILVVTSSVQLLYKVPSDWKENKPKFKNQCVIYSCCLSCSYSLYLIDDLII